MRTALDQLLDLYLSYPVSFAPQFTISSRLLREIETIGDLRARIAGATIQVAWISHLQKDSRDRGAHASTAIEGNPLTLEEVRALEAGTPLPTRPERARREVLNYFAGLRWVEKRARQAKPVGHVDIFSLHRLLAAEVMNQGEAGRYRTMAVRVRKHTPPPPDMVSGLMRELLAWWNGPSTEWSPVLTSAILHYQFEEIHPFADGNGRTGRMLALCELYRRGFDTHHIFSIDEFFWEDRGRYYASLASVPRQGGDLTGWLEYTTEGVRTTLERVWLRVQQFAAKSGAKKTVLRPKQEQLLHLLRDHQSMTPNEIWAALGVTKQGAAHILAPLLKARLVKRIGARKTGRYVLG
jgi:Fic family protein